MAIPELTTFTTFDGLSIAYFDIGAGRPVILVHGFTSTARAGWAAPGLADALVAAGRRVVALDLRGHGSSDKPHALTAYEGKALARDVVALADHLGFDEYDIAGYSLGAIVVSTVIGLDLRVQSAVMAGMGHWLLNPDWERPKKFVEALTGAGSDPPPDVKDLIEFMQLRGNDPLAMAGVQHGHVALLPEEAAAITIPVLVLAGVGDDTNGDPDKLAAAIPGSTVVRTPGDHLTAVPTPELRDALVSWLS